MAAEVHGTAHAEIALPAQFSIDECSVVRVEWEEVGGSVSNVMAAKPETTALFAGEFRHVMDVKHRITIPARWRDANTAEFFLVPGQGNDHLLGYTASEFEKVSRLVEENAAIPANERRIFVRQFYSKANVCPIDKQGRILLADSALKIAGVESDLFLAGAFNRFEIWNPERWSRVKEDEQKVFARVASMVGL